ncbi:MAG TPA: isoprenylcysteine carboxylmethyltransferase family protein [Anaerolineales bacterium]|nr:isoprenylcysteine carboxylmethyltransferase family protein [Anaerolineales bacterium]HNQ93162.1 isoprenylcysteine carboxylmethyltransferase family protein [Anaerolineales bacterium]HNS59392.1 isoprenylcysteine carboxylmethyltransferase family protein [Anaerolineales bacterium]
MFWVIFAVAFWGFFHSFNSTVAVKEFIRRALGDGFMKFYRLAFNVVAVLTFLPIPFLLLALPSRLLYRVPAPFMQMMIAGQVFFAACLFTALYHYGILYFIGLRQLVELPGERKLVESGSYAVVRHPFYTYFLLFLWLTPLMTVNLLIAYLSLTAYIHIGIYFEERKLLREFGEEYAKYRANTPMLIPGLKFGRNKSRSPLVLEPQSTDKA